MRSSQEFRDAVRRGVRMGRPTLVVHATSLGSGEAGPGPQSDVRVGFVVSKAVGNAVTRNRVKRRLRHLTVLELPATPPGTRVVVRALPRAATNPHELADDLDRAWEKAMFRLSERDRRPVRRARP
jgi:ribonuclease P protein component